ncbi:MAG: hypothetical protein AB6733_00150 [Clostridiaceae bacterium]
MKKNVLWKYDHELGIAFFCPACKVFICTGLGPCPKCKQELNWDVKDKYEGEIKWD